MATEERFQYQLTLNTRATGTGARDTAADMQRLAAATSQANDKAKVSEFAYYDLDAALKTTNTGTQTLSSGVTQLGRSIGNRNAGAAQSLYVFSQGFEDLAYGFRGVINNIPQLVLAMGGTAGLAGAISVAAVAGNMLYRSLSNVEEKASDVEDRITEVADSMGQIEADRFEEVGDAIESARDRAAALKQEFDDTRAAEQSFSISAIDNAGKLVEAQRNIAVSLGLQVDSYRELQAIAAAEEEKRRLAAEQAVAAERQKVETAKEAATAAADFFAEQQNRAASEQGNLVRLRGELALLREQRAELERIAETRTTSDDPGRQLLGAIFPKTLPLTDEAKAARTQLEDQVFKTRLEGTESRVTEMERLVDTLTKDGGIVQKAENAFLTAQNQLTDLSQAVGVNISRIEQTLAADNLLARSQNIAATQEQQAKDLAAAVGEIETTTEVGRQAKASIEAAAADGRITANESDRLARDSVALIGQIQAGLATAGTNTIETLNLLRAIATREQQTRRELAEVRRQVEELLR